MLSKDDGSLDVDQKQYRSMIGGLLYLTDSRLHIMQVVYLVARYQANPKKSHYQVVKRIFRYLKGTLNYGLWYKNDDDFTLKSYTDFDWVRCAYDRRRTSGGTFFLGDRLVSWLSKKQDSMSLSTTKS